MQSDVFVRLASRSNHKVVSRSHKFNGLIIFMFTGTQVRQRLVVIQQLDAIYVVG